MLEGTQSKEHSGNIRILGSAKWEVAFFFKFGGEKKIVEQKKEKVSRMDTSQQYKQEGVKSIQEI